MRMIDAALGLAAFAGACSPGGEGNRQAGAAAVPKEAEAKAPPPPVANGASSGRAEAPRVALAGDGLTLVGQGGGTRQLPFGTPEQEAVRILTAALGSLPVEQGVNRDCGAGPLGFANFRGGLDLLIQDGRFVGWFFDADGTNLRTMSGIGIGSTRSELDAAYDASVEESTLGQEFTSGELGGILSSAAPDARIEALWAGMACMFR